jgi:DNA-binding FadR family transcriptional regulator
VKASERVAREVARGILNDELPVGTMLATESSMAERYAVGRSTVREALRLLEAWGAIEIRQGRNGGPLTKRPDAQTVGEALLIVMQFQGVALADLFHTRRVLDAMLARLAAESMTDSELMALGEAVKGIGDNIDDVERYFAYNDRFYEVLAGSCRNPALQVLFESLKSVTVDLMYELGNPVEWRRRSVELRRRVFRAIASGSPEEAAREMTVYQESMWEWWSTRFPEELNRPIDVLRADRQVAPTSKDREGGRTADGRSPGTASAKPRPLRGRG